MPNIYATMLKNRVNELAELTDDSHRIHSLDVIAGLATDMAKAIREKDVI